MSNELIINKVLLYVAENKISPREAKLLAFSFNREFITTNDAAKTLGIPSQNANVMLVNLIKKGVFFRKRAPHDDNKFYYFFKKKVFE